MVQFAREGREWREAVIWAAGLFEGEGCLTLSNGRDPHAQLKMTDRDVVERFRVVMGFGSLHVHGPSGLGRKPQWQWDTSTQGTQALIAMFWPWLGERRRARAKEILAIGRGRKCRLRGRTHCEKGHPFDAANTYWHPNGKGRSCLTCKRARDRAGNRRRPSRRR